MVRNAVNQKTKSLVDQDDKEVRKCLTETVRYISFTLNAV